MGWSRVELLPVAEQVDVMRLRGLSYIADPIAGQSGRVDKGSVSEFDIELPNPIALSRM